MDKNEKDGLEDLLISKLQPAIDSMMQKFMGVRIHELSDDLTSRLTKDPLLGFDIDTSLPYRQAKKKFRKEYFRRLLIRTYGNVSEVARISKMERRSIHRFLIDAKINVQKMRDDMLHPDYVKEIAIGKAVVDALRQYEAVLHPDKIKKLYDDIPEISKDLLKELPNETVSLKTAEEEFQKKYFANLLKDHLKVGEIAKKAGLRYEVVHRKMKKLGLI